MNENPEMVGLGGELPDAVDVTFRANWAMTSPESPDATIHPLFAVSVTTYEIPPLMHNAACASCSHGLHDVIGFVVAYSHLSQNGVRFTDMAYVKGAQGYTQAKILRNQGLDRIQRGLTDATYVVIHWVYEGGHRTS